MAPFMPKKAQALWAMLGQPGEVARTPWRTPPRAGAWRVLSSGQALGRVEALFPKIDDATIAEEVAALERRRAP